MRSYDKMIFDLSVEGRRAYSLPALDVPEKNLADFIPPEHLRSEGLDFPDQYRL